MVGDVKQEEFKGCYDNPLRVSSVDSQTSDDDELDTSCTPLTMSLESQEPESLGFFGQQELKMSEKERNVIQDGFLEHLEGPDLEVTAL